MDQPDSRAMEAIRRFEQMAGMRGLWESLWQEIGELTLPRQSDFTTTQEPGAKRHRLYDSFQCGALERFAAVMESALVPTTQVWSQLSTGDEDLDEEPSIKLYLEAANKRLWRHRYSPRANFASQAHEHFMSLGAFGSGCVLVEEAANGRGCRYKQIHLGEVYAAENHQGVVDVVVRKFEMTTRQMLQKFGEDVPRQIAEAIEKEPEKKHAVLHCVWPREDYDKKRIDLRGMRFEELYVCLEHKKMLREGGFFEQPYVFSRYVTTPREVYGRSPAMTYLATIKMLQAMAESNISAANFAVDPVIGMADDSILGAQKWRPGLRIPGAITEDGKTLVQSLSTGGDPAFGIEFQERERRVVDDGFFGIYFRTLIDNPNMTATAVLELAQQQGQMAQPMVSRQQTEFLGPLIRRESAVLHRQGLMPEPPEALIEWMVREREPLLIEYQSPHVDAMRSRAAIATLRTFEALAPIAQVDPSVYGQFHMGRLGKIVAEGNGIPAEAFMTEDEQAAKQQQDQAQQMAAQVLQAAPVAASAAKDMAMAEAQAAAVPQQQGLWPA